MARKTKVAKRKTTKKATRKKTSSRAAAAAPPKPKVSAAGKKARTKSQVIGEIAEHSGLSRKEVTSVFDIMGAMIEKDLGSRGPGTFTVPGLMKIKVRKKPATKARKGINPFTGEEMMFKAKPATNVVKVLPLKGLKEMV